MDFAAAAELVLAATPQTAPAVAARLAREGLLRPDFASTLEMTAEIDGPDRLEELDAAVAAALAESEACV